LAVAARQGEGKTLTVLDLKSGVPQSTIDTPFEVHGLRMIGNTVVVIGGDKAVTWDLPGGCFLPDVTRTTHFHNEVPQRNMSAVSISHDLRYISIGGADKRGVFLKVYCISTRQILREETMVLRLWFAPGGQNIWCADDEEATLFAITEDALDHVRTVDIEDGSWGFPWGSPHGYKVTDDWWIIGASGKRLLMLPSLWQSQSKVDRVWNGRFFALLHRELPEPVILELEP
jgi:hypothetical protein